MTDLIYFLLGTLLIVGSYFAPTIVGAVRKVPNLGSVAVVNTLTGWTFVGWVVALAMAVRSIPVAEHRAI